MKKQKGRRLLSKDYRISLHSHILFYDFLDSLRLVR